MIAKTSPPYYPIEQILLFMDEPAQAICRAITERHQFQFKVRPGSTKIHQNWVGGYWDHVTEVCNLAVIFYRSLEATGRLEVLHDREKFNLSDVLVVLFVHDIEKPWRFKNSIIKTKNDRANFRLKLIKSHGLKLTPYQRHALKFVEGVRDKDYSPGKRTIKPLAVFCHMCDYMSARMFYDFPRHHDPWKGAARSGQLPIDL